MVTKITKKVGSSKPVTLTAKDNVTGVAVAINNAASLVVTPWPADAKNKDFVTINITKGSKLYSYFCSILL